MDKHYWDNHHKRPHEQLVSGLRPPDLHKSADMNKPAYVVLVVILALALVVLALLGLAMWLDYRRRNKEEKQNGALQTKVTKKLHHPNQQDETKLYTCTEAMINRNLYPNPEIEEKESLFESSVVTTTTTEIQPKAPPMSSEKIDDISRKSSFGVVNVHRQQQSSNASSTADFGIHKSASHHLYPMKPPSSSSATMDASSTTSLTGNASKRMSMSKMESFPFEEFGIPENERVPIMTRVQDLKTYDHFLHITQIDSELLEDESNSDSNNSGNDDSERAGRFESQPTLPRGSFDRSLH